MPPGNAATRFGSGVHVGGLGVVVEVDAVDGGHEFQAMFDGLKLLDGAGNRRRATTPASRAAQTAASTFSTLCSPLSGNLLRAA